MLTMLDMGISNLQSVVDAFGRVGAGVRVTCRAADVQEASLLILPGVGAFGRAMERLRELGLVEPLRRHAGVRGRPLIGICLGMQLLADSSEELGRHEGLGLLRGRVVRLSPARPGDRVPNMGWCDVHWKVPADRAGDAFYFAHSFHLECADPADVAATIDYGGRLVTAAVRRGPIAGMQFHPEKSQDAGLDVLEALVKEYR